MLKKRRNKEETIKKVQEILFKQILEKGYNKVNINNVAKEAKISVGTLYHHFEKGKIDIILKYFTDSKDMTLNIEDLSKFNQANVPEVFEPFISTDISNQRKNRGYRTALRQAILSDKTVHDAFRKKIVEICTDIVKQLRETNIIFSQTPEQRLVQRFVFLYNLIEALIHHNLFIMEFFETDEELTNYILQLIEFSLKYFQKLKDS